MGHFLSKARGFTLVEIMVVVIIIGVVAAIAIPVFNMMRMNSQATRIVNDMKTYRTAFEMHAFEMGIWPPDVNRGTIPPTMADYLRDESFTEITVVGGNWDWDFDQSFAYAAISIIEPTGGTNVMQKIDEMLDDGALESGEFKQVAGARFALILEEQ